MNIAELLQQRAAQCPQDVALVDFPWGRRRTMGFGEVDLAVRRVATLMLESGLRPGDRVLVLCPMSAELYITLAAIFRLGLVATFSDTSMIRNQDQVSRQDRSPRGFVGNLQAHLLRYGLPSLRKIPICFAVGCRLPGTIPLQRARRVLPCEEFPDVSGDTPALVTFTSGTGGQSKAAMRTHGFLMAQYRALQQTMDLDAGQRDLATLPMFVLPNLASGLTSCLPPPRSVRPPGIQAARLASIIKKEGIDRLGGTPVLFERLMEYCQSTGTDFPGLRRLYAGGGPIYPQLLAGLRKIAPRAKVTAVYGSTEAEPIACLDDATMDDEDAQRVLRGQGLPAGPPVPLIDLRIIEDRWGHPIGPLTQTEFEAICRPTGSPGEIVVRGNHVLQGYLNPDDDGETKFQVDQARWHRTGDAGYVDERGRLWLLGRCAGCVHDDLGRHYPLSVEPIARQFPEVRKAAMVLLGDQRILSVETRTGRLDQELQQSLKKSLEFMNIQQVHVLGKMPVDRRHHAKIDYAALRGILESQRGS